MGPSNRVVTCQIVRILTGLEVRVEYGPDETMHTKLTHDLETARHVAAEFRAAVILLGGFHELDLPRS